MSSSDWVVVAILVAGGLLGLLLLLGRDSSEQAVATAVQTTVAGASEFELVRLVGVLSSPAPLKGPVSGRELAFLSGGTVTITVVGSGRNRRRQESVSLNRDWGEGLRLSDQTGSIEVLPFDCEMVLPTRFRAFPGQLPNFEQVAGPGASAYDERGIPNGAEVLMVGRVETRDGKRLLTGGHEMLLSALSLKQLGRQHLVSRLAGGVLVAACATGLGLLGYALFFRGGG